MEEPLHHEAQEEGWPRQAHRRVLEERYEAVERHDHHVPPDVFRINVWNLVIEADSDERCLLQSS